MIKLYKLVTALDNGGCPLSPGSALQSVLLLHLSPMTWPLVGLFSHLRFRNILPKTFVIHVSYNLY